MSYYLHHTPGRLRVRIPQIKHRSYMVNRVRELFTNQPDVHGVDVNPTTGSVKIYYDPKIIQADQLLKLLKHNGLFDEKGVIDQAAYYQEAGRKAGTALGKAAFSWTMGRVLESNGFSLLAALI